MKKILEALIMLLLIATVLIEVYCANCAIILAVLYYALLACVLSLYRNIVLIVIIFKIACFYMGLGCAFFLGRNWSDYPLYLCIPRILFWIVIALFPIQYFRNARRNSYEDSTDI